MALLLAGSTKAVKTKWNYSRAKDPNQEGLPWASKQFFENNDEEVNDHVKAFGEAARGLKCFGRPCKDSFLQLDEAQPYGVAEKERDTAAGYPETIAQAGLRDVMKNYVD